VPRKRIGADHKRQAQLLVPSLAVLLQALALKGKLHMKRTSIVLAAFVLGVSLLHTAPSFVRAEEQAQDKASLMQLIEDYVVANKGWERGSFFMEPDPFAGEGGFSVVKKNRPPKSIIGGDENSFLIRVDLKTRKIIGTFAYQ
jgi:hypothetical protein